jgi:hypothetical protein
MCIRPGHTYRAYTCDPHAAVHTYIRTGVVDDLTGPPSVHAPTGGCGCCCRGAQTASP